MSYTFLAAAGTFKQSREELEKARLIIYRLRMRSKGAAWFCSALIAIESLIKGLMLALENVQRVSK